MSDGQTSLAGDDVGRRLPPVCRGEVAGLVVLDITQSWTQITQPRLEALEVFSPEWTLAPHRVGK